MNRDIASATFVGQIYKVETKAAGNGRIQIDFGADAIEEIQLAQRVALARGCAFQVALVAIEPGAMPRKDGQDFEVDPETGEIQL